MRRCVQPSALGCGLRKAPKVVSELLGHSTIGTTESYAHLAPDNHRDAVRVLDPPRQRQHNGDEEEVSS